jgi:hypothetical protein
MAAGSASDAACTVRTVSLWPPFPGCAHEPVLPSSSHKVFMHHCLAFAFVAVTALACGGIAVIDAESEGAAAGGAAAGGAPSSVAVTTTTGPSLHCTRPEDCGARDYCDFPDGRCDGEGVCRPRPVDCPADCPGVCACDGSEHCNACGVNAAGLAVAGDAPCVRYGARYIAGLVDELLLYRRSLAPPTCVTIAFTQGDGPPGLSIAIPSPWVPLAAVATPAPDDCPFVIGGEWLAAADAKGGVALEFSGQAMTIPCALIFEANVTFTEAPGWLPSTNIPFELGTVPVEDGCL